jgi:hypothetical protein
MDRLAFTEMVEPSKDARHPPNDGSQDTPNPHRQLTGASREQAHQDGESSKAAVVEQFGTRSAVHAQAHIIPGSAVGGQRIGHRLLLLSRLRLAAVLVAARLRFVLHLVVLHAWQHRQLHPTRLRQFFTCNG